MFITFKEFIVFFKMRWGKTESSKLLPKKNESSMVSWYEIPCSCDNVALVAACPDN
jgi:hypothetical protein